MIRDRGPEIDECRAALEKVLDSETLSGSRRLSAFCVYSAEAAFAGREEIEQYEIAREVLGRDTDFNPYEDAAVRKLATQLRHKLAEYYAGLGKSDPVVISLPHRSYVLRFRRHSEGTQEAIEEPAEIEESGPLTTADHDIPESSEPPSVQPPMHTSGWRWLAVGVVLGAVPLLVWMGWMRASLPPTAAGSALRPGSIVIETAEGDLRGKEIDIAPGAVQLGPMLGKGEDAIVRLRFTPEYSTQQAGLMAIYDADNYIRLGQHFKNRPMLEFGFEWKGIYEQPLSLYLYDPFGQLGRSRWLSLRRDGNRYASYTSENGFAWTPFGNPVTMPDRADDPHVAIYAFNGRSSSLPARAEFDQLGAGIAFHHRQEGPFRPAPSDSWQQRVDCENGMSTVVEGGTLQLVFAPGSIGCNWDLLHAAPPGDWAISALIDFEPAAGSSFGLMVRGTQSFIALTRRDLDGRSIQLERRDDRDTRIDDFLGYPPVLLRLEKRGAVIRGSVSRDFEKFVPLPAEAPVEELGKIRSLGVAGSVAHWTGEGGRPAARVYWIRLETLNTNPLP